MEKVEQYIKEHTNRYSNHVSLAPYITGFTEWLTIIAYLVLTLMFAILTLVSVVTGN